MFVVQYQYDGAGAKLYLGNWDTFETGRDSARTFGTPQKATMAGAAALPALLRSLGTADEITMRVVQAKAITRFLTINSETEPGVAHLVTCHSEEGWACACPDYLYRRRDCKHIVAARCR